MIRLVVGYGPALRRHELEAARWLVEPRPADAWDRERSLAVDEILDAIDRLDEAAE